MAHAAILAWLEVACHSAHKAFDNARIMFDALKTLTSPAWAYPLFEVIHIVGIALLLGNLVALEMRVFGRAAALSVDALARLSLGLALTGFALALVSGLLMFSTRPAELLTNAAFLIKIVLLAIAGVNAALFHWRGSLRKLDWLARGQMLLSTALWLAVIFCGRWIAY